MTSRAQTVACMLTVVGEGRCALVATHQIFQFVVGYAMAQAFATNLLYTHGLMMGNNMYMVQDLLFITVLAALMGRTRPRSDGLAAEKPPGRVVSAPLLVATVAQLAVVAAFQVAALLLLRASPGGYPPTRGTPDLKTIVAPETSVIYLTCLAQFLVLALVFNRGRPHRRPLWTNPGMVLSMLAQLAFLLYSLFRADAFTKGVEQLVGDEPPFTPRVRGALLALMGANLAAAFFADAASRPVVRMYARRAAAEAEGVGRRGCCGGLLGVFFSSSSGRRRGGGGGAWGEAAAPLAAGAAALGGGGRDNGGRSGPAGGGGLDLGLANGHAAAAAAALPAQRLQPPSLRVSAARGAAAAASAVAGLPPRPPPLAAGASPQRGEELL